MDLTLQLLRYFQTPQKRYRGNTGKGGLCGDRQKSYDQ